MVVFPCTILYTYTCCVGGHEPTSCFASGSPLREFRCTKSHILSKKGHFLVNACVVVIVSYSLCNLQTLLGVPAVGMPFLLIDGFLDLSSLSLPPPLSPPHFLPYTYQLNCLPSTRQTIALLVETDTVVSVPLWP